MKPRLCKKIIAAEVQISRLLPLNAQVKTAGVPAVSSSLKESSD